jgi:hypothetical protein
MWWLPALVLRQQSMVGFVRAVSVVSPECHAKQAEPLGPHVFRDTTRPPSTCVLTAVGLCPALAVPCFFFFLFLLCSTDHTQASFAAVTSSATCLTSPSGCLSQHLSEDSKGEGRTPRAHRPAQRPPPAAATLTTVLTAPQSRTSTGAAGCSSTSTSCSACTTTRCSGKGGAPVAAALTGAVEVGRRLRSTRE